MTLQISGQLRPPQQSATAPVPGGTSTSATTSQEDRLQWHHFFSTPSLCFSAQCSSQKQPTCSGPSPAIPNGSDPLRLGPSIAIHIALACLVVSRGADGLPADRRAKALSGLTLRLGSSSGAPRPIATEATLPLGSRDEAVWISSDDATAVAAKRFRFIQAASNLFYLDCGAGGWVGNHPVGNSRCEPLETWQNAYTFDPFANLTAAQTPLVLSGQQLLREGRSGSQNLESFVWPRTAASAEVFLTGPGGNVSAALPRLHELGYRSRSRGV
ncbi:hypothetical protein EDB92DRAFT_1948971 [Lactarius akahatsu]|uniref:beta-N-acetylhexosaminidase n=1 Tax=Lactarius akahatsu TaxID=416441 RepID=A0AAD4QBB7_9AGAM|nr:hypothetical protein EDB92DRAFT_1948971 [Lactarius akahatsu]